MSEMGSQSENNHELKPLFRIFLIGFPEHILTGETIRDLIPEAEVASWDFEYDVRLPNDEEKGDELSACLGNDVELSDAHTFTSDRDSGDIWRAVSHEDPSDAVSLVSVGSLASPVKSTFCASRIKSEAYKLLRRIRHAGRNLASDVLHKAVVAGYGIGGIIIKQAILIANTDPIFYDTAFLIDTLVFFATPHRPTEQQTWKGLLLGLMANMPKRSPTASWEISVGLEDAVTSLSSSFFRYETGYAIKNIAPSGSPICEDDCLGELVQWPDEDDRRDPSRPNEQDFIRMKLLRVHLTPICLLSFPISHHVQESEIYFQFLRTLSVSRWAIYERRAGDRDKDLDILKDSYRDVLQQDFLGQSLQVVGPVGYGRSAILKLLTQRIQQQCPVVLIEYLPSAQPSSSVTLFSMLVSTIHQILSQSPSCFHSILPLAGEMLSLNVWTASWLKHIISTIMRCSRGIDFLFIIYDFSSSSWISEVRDWWLEMAESLTSTPEQNVTFLISNDETIPQLIGDTANKGNILDLAKNSESCRKRFITRRANELLASIRNPNSTLTTKFEGQLRKTIVYKATKFSGSLYEVDLFLTNLFQRFPLTIPSAIVKSVEQSPGSSEDLYELQASRLVLPSNDRHVISWARDTLSWIVQSVHPLRIEELALAAAVSTFAVDEEKEVYKENWEEILSRIRDQIVMDVEGDIGRHMQGLVTVENGYARMTSPRVRDVLHNCEGLQPHGDAELTRICLWYLTRVLRLCSSNREWWEKCQFYAISARDEAFVYGSASLSYEPILELLWYAVGFWPLHFLRVQRPALDLKNQVVSFLQDSDGVGQRWFHLYLAYNSVPPAMFQDELPTPAQVKSDHKAALHHGTDNLSAAVPEGDEGTSMIWPRVGAIQMAAFLGLSSIVQLLDSGHDSNKYTQVMWCRGSVEQVVTVLRTTSKFHLECLIANEHLHGIDALLDADMDGAKKLRPLHMAARIGSARSVQAILRRLPLAAITELDDDDKGRTVLHAAAISGSCTVIRELINTEDHYPEVAKMVGNKDRDAETPVLLATRLGNTDLARLLATVGEGQCLTVCDKKGQLPIHHAVLFCPGVIPNFHAVLPSIISAPDRDKATPLHIAARWGRGVSVEALLDAAHESGCINALVDAEDASGRLPLSWAVDNGHVNIVKRLLTLTISATYEVEDLVVKLAVQAVQRGHLTIFADILASAYPKIWEKSSLLLTKAAESGQLIMAKFLLGSKFSPASPDGDDREKYTPLGLAAAKGLVGICRILLQFGANINAGGNQKGTPLVLAAEHDHEPVVRLLLEEHITSHDGKQQHINLNTPDPVSRKTPLHYAASNGSLGIITLLLGYEADLKTDTEAQTEQQETPLHLAVEHPEAVKILLQARANISVEDILRQTPLHKSIRSQNIETTRILIEHGASLSAIDWEGHRPSYPAIVTQNNALLQELLQVEYPQNVLWDDLGMLLELCKNSESTGLYQEGFALLARRAVEKEWAFGDDKQSLLHIVSKQGPVEFIDVLITLGLDLNGLDQVSRTPLHISAAEGESTVTKKLIDLEADLNQPDRNGDTPLSMASMYGMLDACKILLTAGAWINEKNDECKTALYHACYEGHTDVVEALLRYKADPNVHSGIDWSPLHAASDNEEITKLLIENGANMNYQKQDGWAPMHFSASWGYQEAVRLLLDNGADPNNVTEDGETPLHLALLNGNSRVVETMVNHRGQNSVDFVKKNSEGLAPIHVAARHKFGSESLPLLVQAGVDLKSTTDDGQSCLDLAIAAGNPGTVKFILAAQDSNCNELAWDGKQLSAAYWKAAELASMDSLSILARRDPSLVQQLSEWGLNALEVVARQPGESDDEDEDDSSLVTLLECGFNPLRPSQPAGHSAIELAVLSRLSACENFVSRWLRLCSDKGVSSLEYFGSPEQAFRTLRAVTELNEKENWTALESLYKLAAVQDETDADGWNINHFLYQCQPRQEFAPWRDAAICQKTRTPKSLIRPPTWRKEEDPELESPVRIHESGIEATFHDNASRIVALRADSPFPPRERGVAYFEVTITHNNVEDSESEKPVVTIGLAGEFADLRKGHCGWGGWSAAYHSDDGLVYSEQSDSDSALSTKNRSTYGHNSTVGCGIDYRSGEYFFTLQGEVVFQQPSKMIFRKLYPCLSHDGSATTVEVNFGTPAFLWEEVRMLAPPEEVVEPEADNIDDSVAMPPPSEFLKPALRRQSTTSDFQSYDRSTSRESKSRVGWSRETSRQRRGGGSSTDRGDDGGSNPMPVEMPKSVLFRVPSPVGFQDVEEAPTKSISTRSQKPSRRLSSRRIM